MHRMYEEYNEMIGNLYSHSTLEQEAHDRGDDIYTELSYRNDAITDIVDIIQSFEIERQNFILNAVYERLKHSRKVSIKETKKALKQML